MNLGEVVIFKNSDNCLGFFFRKNVERRCLLDNMEGVFLVVDEIIDGG